MSTTKCPNCGINTDTSYKYCIECGNKIIKTPIQVVIQAPQRKASKKDERDLLIIIGLSFILGFIIMFFQYFAR